MVLIQERGRDNNQLIFGKEDIEVIFLRMLPHAILCNDFKPVN